MSHRTLRRLTWLLLAAWAGGSAAAEPLVVDGPTMGTTYRIVLPSAAATDEAALRELVEAILADVDLRLSTYRRDSEVSRFNRAAAGEWFAVSPATAEVFAAALAICERTEGALDITVAPLVRLWHFGPDAIAKTDSPADIAPPGEAAIEAARMQVGFQRVEVRDDPPALRKQVAGLEVDLSAVGEGDAIDRLAAALAARGIGDYLIELGGEIRAGGCGPRGQPWRVAVNAPRIDRSEAQAVVSLSNMAVATSGDYRRYFEHGGRRYSHVIDPTTGRPVDHGLAAVTVAADECRTADAWATALMVLGPTRGYQCAEKLDVAALLVSRDGEQFIAQETPAWEARFRTEAPPE